MHNPICNKACCIVISVMDTDIDMNCVTVTVMEACAVMNCIMTTGMGAIAISICITFLLQAIA